MTETSEPYRTPYTPTPGGSTPSPGVTPQEGKRELSLFFWMALLNTVIIGGAGVIAWWLATHP